MAEQSKYPYTTVPGKLRDLLQKIPSVGRPEKVTVAWLGSAGFSSSNDRSILPVLRFVGLIGSDGRPTDLWNAARSPTLTNKGQMGEAIKSAYADLFKLYPDAHRKDAESIRNFFRTHTGGGEQVQSKLVQTFQTLVEFGDFEPSASLEVEDEHQVEPAVSRPAPRHSVQVGKSSLPAGLSLTVNIQLQLPATADGTVYESLFAAMRRHLVELTEPA